MTTNKGFAPIIAIIIAVIIIVGGIGGYLYIKNKNSSNEITKPTALVNTNNWQTFSNQAVSFHYPNNWTATSSEITPSGFGISFKEGSIAHGSINFYVKSLISPNNLTDYEKSWEEIDKGSGNGIYNKQEVVIDGHEAIQYGYSFTNKDGTFYYQTIYIDFGDYLINGSLWGQDKTITDIVHTIYNSLNLKDSKAVQSKTTGLVDTSTWEQFSGDYLNFRYPNDWTIRAKSTVISIISPDKSTNLLFWIDKISELPKSKSSFDVYYEGMKSLESGTISNERQIKVGGLMAKAYDVIDTSGKMTELFLATPNYIYKFIFTPSSDDNYLSAIFSTIKIKLF